MIDLQTIVNIDYGLNGTLKEKKIDKFIAKKKIMANWTQMRILAHFHSNEEQIYIYIISNDTHLSGSQIICELWVSEGIICHFLYIQLN